MDWSMIARLRPLAQLELFGWCCSVVERSVDCPTAHMLLQALDVCFRAVVDGAEMLVTE